ncbi:hypothetical protein PCANC_04982 [Puccinia coronata f. sp. avenae]|uniref:Uncharacterized protein n=1 Tax=Puccinia coronata f. sp. avenae TaxID=200324 RepID=A0A2N5T7N9_9BASI|nr:hypothetical protein PCANC_04982 [Puccinia coronata f. sp. avenae]
MRSGFESIKQLREVIWDHAELEEDKPAFYRNLNARVQSSLDKSIPLVKEFRDIEHQIVKTGEEISENIRPILPPIKDGLSPLEVLGKRLATINSEALAIDRKILRDHLPSTKKYLSKFLGFTGPKNYLAPLNDLAEMAKFHRLHNLRELKDSSAVQEYKNLLASIDENESTLSNLFGSTGGTQRAIKMVENTHLYKELVEAQQKQMNISFSF